MSTTYRIAQLPATNGECIAEVTDMDESGNAVSYLSAIEDLGKFLSGLQEGWDGQELIQVTLLPAEFKVDIEIKSQNTESTIKDPFPNEE